MYVCVCIYIDHPPLTILSPQHHPFLHQVPHARHHGHQHTATRHQGSEEGAQRTEDQQGQILRAHPLGRFNLPNFGEFISDFMCITYIYMCVCFEFKPCSKRHMWIFNLSEYMIINK